MNDGPVSVGPALSKGSSVITRPRGKSPRYGASVVGVLDEDDEREEEDKKDAVENNDDENNEDYAEDNRKLRATYISPAENVKMRCLRRVSRRSLDNACSRC